MVQDSTFYNDLFNVFDEVKDTQPDDIVKSVKFELLTMIISTKKINHVQDLDWLNETDLERTYTQTYPDKTITLTRNTMNRFNNRYFTRFNRYYRCI